jgi:DNA-binding MltR family transcriptional regulator
MSKALKKYLREPYYPWMEMPSLTDELQSGSARGVTVLAAAFADSRLEHVLSSHMSKNTTETERKALFADQGPLSTFSAKIKIVRAFGIIGPKTTHDLELIRTIRNAMAHSQKVLTFKTQVVVQLCGEFISGKSIDNFSELPAQDQFVKGANAIIHHLAWRGSSGGYKKPGESPYRDLD